MANTKKKKSIFGYIFRFILIIIGVFFGLVILLALFDDDTENSENVTYDTATMGEAMSDSGAGNREELVNTFGSDIIRDHYVKLKGNSEDTVTVLVYMNGSDLESEAQEASSDLTEMIEGAGVSDKVNILVQTMGTKNWAKTHNISPKRTERYKLDGNGITFVDDSLKQLDCTKESTLADFLKWGATNYPADRYILLFWNHGAGAVYGFGNDEWVDDEYAALTIDEMQSAFKKAGIFFDFIGMDCCIMSSLEVCCSFYDFCDYTILSEDFESGLGWYYTNWIKALYNNTSIDTESLGRMICDDMVNANVSDTENGDNAILALIDESMIKLLYSAWKEFAYNEQKELMSQNYSRLIKPKRGGRVLKRIYGKERANNKLPEKSGLFDFIFGDDDASLEDYYEVDIMSAASSIDSNVSDQLKVAISNTLVHVAYSEGDSHLTGLAVSLPYGDQDGYDSMRNIFSNVGMDDDYISWLEKFVYIDNSDSYYDYEEFDDNWEGWENFEEQYEDDYDLGSLWDWFFEDEEYYDDYGFDDYDFDEYDYYDYY